MTKASHELRAEVARLRQQYNFFHWPVAFPQVWNFRGRASDVPPAVADDALTSPPV